MISDAKLQLILTLYKNDKLTFEEVKTLLQEEKPFTGQFQPHIPNPFDRIGIPDPLNPFINIEDPVKPDWLYRPETISFNGDETVLK